MTPHDITIARIGLYPYRKPDPGSVGYWWRRKWLSKDPLQATLLRRAVADMGWPDTHPVFPSAVRYIEREVKELRFREIWARKDAEYDSRMAEFPQYRPGPRRRRLSR